MLRILFASSTIAGSGALDAAIAREYPFCIKARLSVRAIAALTATHNARRQRPAAMRGASQIPMQSISYSRRKL